MCACGGVCVGVCVRPVTFTITENQLPKVPYKQCAWRTTITLNNLGAMHPYSAICVCMNTHSETQQDTGDASGALVSLRQRQSLLEWLLLMQTCLSSWRMGQCRPHPQTPPHTHTHIHTDNYTFQEHIVSI